MAKFDEHPTVKRFRELVQHGGNKSTITSLEKSTIYCVFKW